MDIVTLFLLARLIVGATLHISMAVAPAPVVHSGRIRIGNSPILASGG